MHTLSESEELALNPIDTVESVKRAYAELCHQNQFNVSNVYTFVQSVVCVGLYGLLGWIALLLDNILAWLAIWPLQSFLLAGFLGATHDCAHRVHLTWPLGNRIAGTLWATVTTVNFTLYKHFHLDHHRLVGTDQDTEPAGEFESLHSYFASLPTIYFFYTFWRMSWAATRGSFPHFIRSASQRRDVLIDDCALVAWLVIVVALLAYWPAQVIIVYLVPLLLFFPMVFLFSLPEHYGCEHGQDWRTNTRTITSHPVVSYLYWNGNYHADHHVFPRIASRYLPKAHAQLAKEFKFVGRSYAAFHLALITKLSSSSAADALEAGTTKVLSPSERIHYDELFATAQSAATKTDK